MLPALVRCCSRPALRVRLSPLPLLSSASYCEASLQSVVTAPTAVQRLVSRNSSKSTITVSPRGIPTHCRVLRDLTPSKRSRRYALIVPRRYIFSGGSEAKPVWDTNEDPAARSWKLWVLGYYSRASTISRNASPLATLCMDAAEGPLMECTILITSFHSCCVCVCPCGFLGRSIRLTLTC